MGNEDRRSLFTNGSTRETQESLQDAFTMDWSPDPSPEVPLGFDPDWIPPKRLKEKNNFVERFIYLQGTTEVPEVYYRFVALSLLSALLQDAFNL